MKLFVKFEEYDLNLTFTVFWSMPKGTTFLILFVLGITSVGWADFFHAKG